MSGEAFDVFLSGVIGISAVMAFINLFLANRRGTSAYVLAAAFVLLGVGAYLYKISAADWVLGLIGAILIILLFTDFALRTRTKN